MDVAFRPGFCGSDDPDGKRTLECNGTEATGTGKYATFKSLPGDLQSFGNTDRQDGRRGIFSAADRWSDLSSLFRGISGSLSRIFRL